MYPFSTIARTALTYDKHDPRHTASQLGPFEHGISKNIVHALSLHDAASFRNASMINLYSYFECEEARTEHGARLATERVGATLNVPQMQFDLYSVLDVVQDNTRHTTPASKARILARLIDEILRCRLLPLDDAGLSRSVAGAVIAATAELPVTERAGMRWRLVNPLFGDTKFGYKHQLDNFIEAAIESSGDLPVEEREKFQLAQKVHRFWLRLEGDECNLTPAEATELISLILSLPHERQVALLTRLADKIGSQRSHSATSDAVRLALFSACKDWPLCERLRILTEVSPGLTYPHANFPWNLQQRDDVREKETLLKEYRLLPISQKPAALAQLICYFKRRVGPSYFEFLPTALPWPMASALVAEAAKLKSVHSSAVVMAELRRVVPFFKLHGCKPTAALFTKAFSANNDRDARTRSRQLLGLDHDPRLFALLCKKSRTVHPKTQLAASLLLRIAELNPQEDDGKCTQEPVAIWKEASALGSRRSSDIRSRLLDTLSKLSPNFLLPAFETILQDSHKLPSGLKVKLCLTFADVPFDWDGEAESARPVIDAVIDLALSLPSRDLQATLRKVMGARCIRMMHGEAIANLLTSVFDKCLAMPTAVIAPALIELACFPWFHSQENHDAGLALFYKILEKSTGFNAEHKGPLLASLAIWFDFTATEALESACNALMSECDTLPEASRDAWRLYLRIVTGDHHRPDQDSRIIDQVVKNFHKECDVLDGPLSDFLRDSVMNTFYPGRHRFSSNF